MANREELIQAVRDGWPQHGSTTYWPKRGYVDIPTVREGGLTNGLIEFAVDTVLARLNAADTPTEAIQETIV